MPLALLYTCYWTGGVTVDQNIQLIYILNNLFRIGVQKKII